MDSNEEFGKGLEASSTDCPRQCRGDGYSDQDKDGMPQGCGNIMPPHAEQSRLQNPSHKTYPCDHCGKIFTTRQNLSSHNRIRLRVFPYKCEFCDMAFTEYSTLFKHKKTHAVLREKFQCEKCEISFLSKIGLRKHKEKKHINTSASTPGGSTGASLTSPRLKKHQQKALIKHTNADKSTRTGDIVVPSTSNTSLVRDLVQLPEDNRQVDRDRSPVASIGLLDKALFSRSSSVGSVVVTATKSTGDRSVKVTKGSEEKCSSFGADHILSESTDFVTSRSRNRASNGGSLENDKSVRQKEDNLEGPVMGMGLRSANKENSLNSCGTRAGKRSSYKCEECPMSFGHQKLLLTHVTTCHAGAKRYCCWECDRVFASSIALQRHALKHSKNFKCKFCDKTFCQKVTLDGHLRCHTGERPFSCEVCDKSFAHYQSRDCHMRLHTQEKVYRCQSCDFKTSWRSSMSTHLLVHKGERPHKCTKCQMSFTQKSQLKRHIRGVHDPDKNCKICGSYVKNRKTMIAHMAQHNGDTPFNCEYCNEGFLKRFQLKKHILETHTLPNRCDDCGAAFAYPSGLKAHKLMHTRKRDFVCEFENCGAKFSRMSNLNAHKRLHTGDLPFACNLCDRKYDRRALLVVHVRNFHEAKRVKSAPRRSKYRVGIPHLGTSGTKVPTSSGKTRRGPTGSVKPVAVLETTAVKSDAMLKTTVEGDKSLNKERRVGDLTLSSTPPSEPRVVDESAVPPTETLGNHNDVLQTDAVLIESDQEYIVSEVSGDVEEMEPVPVSLLSASTIDPVPTSSRRTLSTIGPVPSVSSRSPFTEKLRKCLSPPKSLAPVEIWTANDAACFTVLRVPADGAVSSGSEDEDVDYLCEQGDIANNNGDIDTAREELGHFIHQPTLLDLVDNTQGTCLAEYRPSSFNVPEIGISSSPLLSMNKPCKPAVNGKESGVRLKRKTHPTPNAKGKKRQGRKEQSYPGKCNKTKGKISARSNMSGRVVSGRHVPKKAKLKIGKLQSTLKPGEKHYKKEKHRKGSVLKNHDRPRKVSEAVPRKVSAMSRGVCPRGTSKTIISARALKKLNSETCSLRARAKSKTTKPKPVLLTNNQNISSGSSPVHTYSPTKSKSKSATLILPSNATKAASGRTGIVRSRTRKISLAKATKSNPVLAKDGIDTPDVAKNARKTVSYQMGTAQPRKVHIATSKTIQSTLDPPKITQKISSGRTSKICSTMFSAVKSKTKLQTTVLPAKTQNIFSGKNCSAMCSPVQSKTLKNSAIVPKKHQRTLNSKNSSARSTVKCPLVKTKTNKTSSVLAAKTPQTAKTNIPKQRKVSRRPGQVGPIKVSSAGGQLKASAEVGSASSTCPVLKRPRVVRATVKVQDLPVAPSRAKEADTSSEGVEFEAIFGSNLSLSNKYLTGVHKNCWRKGEALCSSGCISLPLMDSVLHVFSHTNHLINA